MKSPPRSMPSRLPEGLNTPQPEELRALVPARSRPCDARARGRSPVAAARAPPAPARGSGERVEGVA
eukprot:2311395-Pleurochrysis_carterae.AAC.1